MIPTAHVSQKCGHIIQYNAREHACDEKTNQYFIVCYGYCYRQPSQGTITWYSLQVLKLLLPAIIHRFVSHIMEIRLVCYSRRHQWQHDTLKGGGGVPKTKGEKTVNTFPEHTKQPDIESVCQRWTLCYKFNVRKPGMRIVPLNSMKKECCA